MSGWQCQSKIPSIIDQLPPETDMATTTTSIAGNQQHPASHLPSPPSYGYVVYYFCFSSKPKTKPIAQ
jgi:hypothetical protein